MSPVPLPTRPISAYPPMGSNPFDPMNQMAMRPQSMMGQNMMQPPSHHMGSMPSSNVSASGLPVQFIPLCRYEDSQAIRAVAFHPSGRHFVIGTNSKQMLLCKYPDIRKIK
jgi:hypothetical protein